VVVDSVLNCRKRFSVSVSNLRHGPHRKHISSAVACMFTATLPSSGHPIVAYLLPREMCLPVVIPQRMFFHCWSRAGWNVLTDTVHSNGWPNVSRLSGNVFITPLPSKWSAASHYVSRGRAYGAVILGNTTQSVVSGTRKACFSIA
jgi:hypothetical protein